MKAIVTIVECTGERFQVEASRIGYAHDGKIERVIGKRTDTGQTGKWKDDTCSFVYVLIEFNA